MVSRRAATLVSAFLVCLSPGPVRAQDSWMAALAINIDLYTGIGTGLDAAVEARTLVYQTWPAAAVRPAAGLALAVSVNW